MTRKEMCDDPQASRRQPRRVIAGLVDLATFAMERPAFADLLNDHAFVLELTFPVRSKAEADKVIEAYAPAARALWRNGVYMAELEPAKLPVSPDRRRILPSEVPSNGGEPDAPA